VPQITGTILRVISNIKITKGHTLLLPPFAQKKEGAERVGDDRLEPPEVVSELDPPFKHPCTKITWLDYIFISNRCSADSL